MGNNGGKDSGGPTRVRVKASTYIKDSYGLFDFQRKDFYKSEIFDLNEKAVIVRQQFSVVPSKTQVRRADSFNLISVGFKNKKPIIDWLPSQFDNMDEFDEEAIRNSPDFHERFIWEVCEGAEIDLTPGVVFRMGRLRFRVREHFDGKNTSGIGVKMNLGSKNEYKHEEDNDAASNTELVCRVCLEPESDDNRFANICQCTRTMPLHAECLMDWIKARMSQRKTDYYKFYSWKLLDCDICKTPFPEFFTIEGRRYDLLSYDKPIEGPYIVIDLFHKDKNTIRGCFVIQNSKTKPEFIIGRANDCEINLKDISISRKHAKLIFRNGNFYLSDMNSKFGTLSLVRRKNLYDFDSKILTRFQIGRTLLEFKLIQQTEPCMMCCGGSSDQKVKLNPFSSFKDDPIELNHSIREVDIVVKDPDGDDMNIQPYATRQENNLPGRGNFATNHPDRPNEQAQPIQENRNAE